MSVTNIAGAIAAQVAAAAPLPPLETRRALRTGAGLSRAQLATVLGVTPQAVAYWETGRRTPRGELKRAYAEALRVLRESA